MDRTPRPVKAVALALSLLLVLGQAVSAETAAATAVATPDDTGKILAGMQPSANSPLLIRANRSTFSSTERSRYGLFRPGSVNVPR